MEYSFEELAEHTNYSEICEAFLSFAKNEETKTKLKDILYTGKTGNFCLKSKFPCLDNPANEIERRIAMASLLIRNPETFLFLEKNSINIFHGTDVRAFPKILKYDMRSKESLKELGISVSTGEKWTQRNNINKKFVSFTDDLTTAADYAGLYLLYDNDEPTFSIILGTTEDEINKAKGLALYSGYSEIGVNEQFPLDAISCICAPDDKIEFIQSLIGNRQITVLEMSDLSSRAYNIDSEFGEIYIFHELYEGKNNPTK